MVRNDNYCGACEDCLRPVNAIKQLIRDVLEEVKPERKTIELEHQGNPQNRRKVGWNRAIDEMESKAKELGL